MKSFLLSKKINKPLISWSLLPDGVFYKGKVPEGHDLLVCPSEGYIIVDIDNKGKKKGSDNIPEHLKEELEQTFHYPTKNTGWHHWFKYTGNKKLKNTTSNLGIDLRISFEQIDDTTWKNGGYVKWHPRDSINPVEAEIKAKETSFEMNKWLFELFG